MPAAAEAAGGGWEGKRLCLLHFLRWRSFVLHALRVSCAAHGAAAGWACLARRMLSES